MAGKIFINYRRGDDPGHTGRLFDRLQDVFEPGQLFLDVDNIAPGLDFVRELNERVAECDIVLAVIGKGWIDARDSAGNRRLDDPDDFVRIEISSALNHGKRVIPVLVGEAQMPHAEELPEALRPLARRNAVRLTHERFRADTQGLVKAIQQGLAEIDARRKAEAEVARRAHAEEEQKQREAEAARRAAEEKRRRLAEAEASERAVAERKRQQAEASQRAQAERAFNVAKRAGTVFALDGFLAAYGTSGFVEEAQIFRAVLLGREAAFRGATASDDPAVLRSFIATYSKGADVDHARKRLRRVEAQHRWRPSAGLMIPVALALALTGGAGAYWFATNRQPSVNRNVPSAANVVPVPFKQAVVSRAPDQAAWDLLKETVDANALKRFVAEYPTSPLRKQAEARLATLEMAQPAKPAPTPPPDELAWQLLKGTTDEAGLKRFAAQYPESPRRKDAEARIATLEAARAAKPPPPQPDEVAWSVLKDTADLDALKRFIAQYPDSSLRKEAEERIATLQAADAARSASATPEEIAWNLLKDSTDPDQWRRFIEQFPTSKMRAQAEQRVATLTAAAAKITPLDTHALALSLQSELKRVGCFNGTTNGEFDDTTRAAERAFTNLTSINLPDALSPEAIDAVRKFDKRVCPLVCPEGQRAEGERCISSAPQKPQQRKTERSKEVPRKKASLERPPAQQATAPAAQPGPGQHLHLGPRYIVMKNGTLCYVHRGHPKSSCQ